VLPLLLPVPELAPVPLLVPVPLVESLPLDPVPLGVALVPELVPRVPLPVVVLRAGPFAVVPLPATECGPIELSEFIPLLSVPYWLPPGPVVPVVPEALGSVPLDVPGLYGVSGPPPDSARACPVSSAPSADDAPVVPLLIPVLAVLGSVVAGVVLLPES